MRGHRRHFGMIEAATEIGGTEAKAFAAVEDHHHLQAEAGLQTMALVKAIEMCHWHKI